MGDLWALVCGSRYAGSEGCHRGDDFVEARSRSWGERTTMHQTKVLIEQTDAKLTSLFVEHVIRINKENNRGLHYWPFVKGIHRFPMDSPHKGPVMLKAFPCPDVIMVYAGSRTLITVTSWWARWCLNSPASWLFTQTITDQRKHQRSASLAFVRGIHRWISYTKGQ